MKRNLWKCVCDIAYCHKMDSFLLSLFSQRLVCPFRATVGWLCYTYSITQNIDVKPQYCQFLFTASKSMCWCDLSALFDPPPELFTAVNPQSHAKTDLCWCSASRFVLDDMWEKPHPLQWTDASANITSALAKESEQQRKEGLLARLQPWFTSSVV